MYKDGKIRNCPKCGENIKNCKCFEHQQQNNEEQNKK